MSGGLYGRVVLIGATQVGKTALIQNYLNGAAGLQSPTVGAVFHTHKTSVFGTQVTLQIWDTAGQERYRSLGPIYYRKSNGAVAVFDLTRPATLPELDAWIDAFKEHADDPFVVVVGNKCDCAARVTIDEAEGFAARHGAQCIWASAVTGERVADVFEAVCKHLADAGAAAVTVEGDPQRPPAPHAGAENCGC
jgi:small GTP-binding protein